jgi:hypothetical protein
MKTVIAQYVDEKGQPFQLVGNLESLRTWIQDWLDTNDTDPDEEYSIHSVDLNGVRDERPTEEDRAGDKAKMKTFLDLDNDYWMDKLKSAVKKKNGTLAKGRVQTLYVSNTFTHYWEDSYAWNGPQIRIQNLSDDTAELQFGNYKTNY